MPRSQLADQVIDPSPVSLLTEHLDGRWWGPNPGRRRCRWPRPGCRPGVMPMPETLAISMGWPLPDPRPAPWRPPIVRSWADATPPAKICYAELWTLTIKPEKSCAIWGLIQLLAVRLSERYLMRSSSRSSCRHCASVVSFIRVVGLPVPICIFCKLPLTPPPKFHFSNTTGARAARGPTRIDGGSNKSCPTGFHKCKQYGWKLTYSDLGG